VAKAVQRAGQCKPTWAAFVTPSSHCGPRAITGDLGYIHGKDAVRRLCPLFGPHSCPANCGVSAVPVPHAVKSNSSGICMPSFTVVCSIMIFIAVTDDAPIFVGWRTLDIPYHDVDKIQLSTRTMRSAMAYIPFFESTPNPPSFFRLTVIYTRYVRGIIVFKVRVTLFAADAILKLPSREDIAREFHTSTSSTSSGASTP